ncbi:MAG: PD-(D/E)XK nuclease family protein [Bacteroidetes bacterium]|nr:PD-(D/E)XK nuclease family protein [Bacteroidota bacterium]MBT6687916.1 PD-(D/E)XK nuclease family protein [Bacteroidota bacterium]MBT7142436.1 PD-(D/E)XK nuclease family protein [Bacteroidota bacterium]MBT7490057.1 PD-(D/E)XK nuclease family protein [Bacteroidota bacterium]
MENIINEFVKESENLTQKKLKNGELFNVFNELTINTKEVKHSLMIKSLLTPNGKHGMGDVFYKLFIDELGLANSKDYEWLSDASNIKVYDEFFIGNKEENEKLENTYWGRIDLLIENKKEKKALVIENKIYAPDQPIQLIRYNNYAKDTYEKYDLYYLTLDGKKPDYQTYLGPDYDSTPENEEYKINIDDINLISYSVHVLNWLDKCLKVENMNNPVKIIVEQYINTLKELTNKMESINKNLLLEQKYREILKVVSENDIREVRDEIRKKFFIKLQEKLPKEIYGKKIDFVHSIDNKVDNIDDVLNSNGHIVNFGIRIETEGKSTFHIEVQNYNRLIFGIFNPNENQKKVYKNSLSDSEPFWLCTEYKIDGYDCAFYDDRLNYHLLENMDNIITEFVKKIAEVFQ